MTKNEAIIAYIEFLGKGDTVNILKLFNKKATVTSPVYGVMGASDFYKKLATDTQSSELTLKTIFHSNSDNSSAIYFNFKWTMANSKIVEFDVVDVFKFDEDGFISDLKIIYDASITKPLISN